MILSDNTANNYNNNIDSKILDKKIKYERMVEQFIVNNEMYLKIQKIAKDKVSFKCKTIRPLKSWLLCRVELLSQICLGFHRIIDKYVLNSG
jgi:hypothetical protein